ncbi:MAG: GspE/PulE family protein [Acidithiobacillus sp.]
MVSVLSRLNPLQSVSDGKSAMEAKKPLGEILLEGGVITAMQLEIALKAQSDFPGKKLGEILVLKGFASAARIHEAIGQQSLAASGKQLDLPTFPADMRDIAVLDGDPATGALLYLLAGRQGQTMVQSWVAEARRRGAVIRIEPCDMGTLAQIQNVNHASDAANLSVVRNVRRIITAAVAEKSSDIHMTLRERDGGKGYLQVQFRIKGTVEDRMQFTETEGAQMIRAMFQGMAAVADASFRETEDQHAVIVNPALLRSESGQLLGLSGIRLARAPLYDGMNLAARLLYRLEHTDAARDLIGMLGYSRRQIRVLRKLARQTMGINPFTGPTGSGKSSTLANMIRTMLIIRPGNRIITIEDPVEFEFDSDFVWQYKIANANTDEEKSRAFSGKLKTALRQDPDIIMLGEIRGLETAKEAVNAAITGHQVWTTLHVSDPFMIVQRLVAMGIDGFYLQDPKMLSSLIAQRLIKVLCPQCSAPADRDALIAGGLDPEDWDNLMTWESERFPISGLRMKGDHKDCKHCGGSGIQGRTVVAQVIPTDEELLVDMVSHGPMIARKHYEARPNAEISMDAHAALKMLRGMTDPRFVVEMLGPIPCRPADLRDLTEEDV